jgi:MFS family permease
LFVTLIKSELSASIHIVTCAYLDATNKSPIDQHEPHLLGLPACIPMEPNGLKFSMLIAVLSLGGLVGSLSTGFISGRLTRRRTFGVMSFILLTSSLVMTLANGYYFLLFGRFLAGIGSGGSATMCSLYFSEVAPPQLRGLFGTHYA